MWKKGVDEGRRREGFDMHEREVERVRECGRLLIQYYYYAAEGVLWTLRRIG